MHRLVVAALAVLVCATAFANSEPAMLWVAEDDDNRVYLLGSIHLLREQDHPLPGIIDTVYEDADRLVMELDMDEIDPLALFRSLQARGILQNGQTLESVMGEEMYAEALLAAEDADIPLNMFKTSEPWLAAMTVQEILMMRVGFKADRGIELTLTARAVADGKPIDGLETVDEQLGFLDGLSLETQNRWLLYSMVEARRIEMMVDDIVAAWRRGDTGFLEKELLADMNNYPEMHEAVLVQRNVRWVAQILDMLDGDEDVLVVVGAAHLVGEDGVPDLLSAKGVRIKQLHESVR